MQKFCITCRAPHSAPGLECEKCNPSVSTTIEQETKTATEPVQAHFDSSGPPNGLDNSFVPEGKRKVGFLLGAGILFLPMFFAWFTLRKGHTKLSKIVAFGWFFVFIISAVLSPPKDQQTASIGSPSTAEMTIQDQLNAICSLPSRVSNDPEISKLGGGEWKKSEFGNSFFGCEGGLVMAELGSETYVKFFATGQENTLESVSVTYGANIYENNQSPEAISRERYAKFLDQVSAEMFGEKLPSDFRSKIIKTNEITDRTALELTQGIGKGSVEFEYRGIQIPGSFKSVKTVDIEVRFVRNAARSSNS